MVNPSKPAAECPDDDVLLQFGHGELTAAAEQDLQAHLDVCSVCRTAVAELAQVLFDPAGEAQESLTDAHTEPVERYTLLTPIGAGGMGIVYLAYDAKLERKIALKVLNTRTSGGLAHDERLLGEAKAMARLAHPHVTAVHDVGSWKGQLFIAMELVQGRTVRQWLLERPRGWRQVLNVFIDAGRGLIAAHEAGLVHRDFKPENVMVGWDDRVRVMDFGLAAAEQGKAPESVGAFFTGAAGTPRYMAPEQLAGGKADARSDQFSFCVALYEALHGTRPFSGETLPALSAAIAESEAKPPRNLKGVPAWLHRAVLKGLAPTPDRRHGSVAELVGLLAHNPTRIWRRRAVVAAGTLTVVAGAVGYFSAQARRGAVCRGAADHLVGLWGAPEREALAKAYAATGIAGAGEAAQRVRAAMDAYAARWVDARTQACEATHVRHEQSAALLDARMRCLDRLRQNLGALAALLQRPDARTVARAQEPVDRLERADACSNLSSLVARVSPPPDAQRAEVSRVQTELAEGKALRDTGHYMRATEALEKAVRSAKAVGYRPLEADALLALGQLAVERKDFQRAEPSLFDAYRASTSAGADELSARAATLLMRVTGRWNRRFEDSARWAQLASSALEHAGGNAVLSAQLDLAQGYDAMAQGKMPEALELDLRAVQRLEEALGPEAPELAEALTELCFVQYLNRKIEAGMPSCKRALAIYEKRYGAGHPLIARPLTSLGATVKAEGKYAEALPYFERAVAVAEVGLGADNADLAIYESNLADTLRALGRNHEAEKRLLRAAEIHERLQGPKHPDLAYDFFNLANVYSAEEKWTEALEAARKAEAILSEGGPASLRVEVLQLLGDVAWEQGRRAEALEQFDRAIAFAEATYGRDHFTVANVLVRLGSAYLDLKQPRKAEPPLRRAHEIRKKTTGLDPIAWAETRFLLARALVESGRPLDEARRLFHDALRDVPATGPGAPELTAEMRSWATKHPALSADMHPR
jgi:tetratricopeptide (TPR) repeat protein